MTVATFSPRLFTSEQLPADQVMLVTKSKDGQEIGCTLADDVVDETIIEVFRAMVKARKAAT